jgi:hypothetical protein
MMPSQVSSSSYDKHVSILLGSLMKRGQPFGFTLCARKPFGFTLCARKPFGFTWCARKPFGFTLCAHKPFCSPCVRAQACFPQACFLAAVTGRFVARVPNPPPACLLPPPSSLLLRQRWAFCARRRRARALGCWSARGFRLVLAGSTLCALHVARATLQGGLRAACGARNCPL